jgi:photosynthetic reaction center cytochrome c subunit
MLRYLLILAAACVALAPLTLGQPPGGGMVMKNLKILKPEEVRTVMGQFRTGTGLACGDCHVQGDFASDDKPQKVTARKMLEMVRGVNANTFAGAEKVTCYTCHRGEAMPKSAP